MNKRTGLILTVFLILELAVASTIVLARPGGLDALGISFITGPERHQEQPLQSFQTPGGVLNIQSDNGKVVVNGVANSQAVTIKATKIAHGDSDSAFDRLVFETRQQGNDIFITAKRRDTGEINFNLDGGDRIDLEITAPASMVAQVQNHNGMISLTNLDNPSAGHSVETHNGEIKVNGVKAGRLQLTSHNGQVVAQGVAATLSAETDNGEINVQDATVNIEKLKSHNGQIVLNGKLQQTGGGNIETNNGTVRLSVQDATGVKFDITTDHGNISYRLPNPGLTQNDKNHIVTNGTGPLLRVQSNNGDVTVQ